MLLSSFFFFDKLVSEVACLVKELPQGLVALPLVAGFSSGDAAGAGADVGRAVLLARVIQVAGLGSIQAVILSGHCWLTYRHGEEAQGQEKWTKTKEKKRTSDENLADVINIMMLMTASGTSNRPFRQMLDCWKMKTRKRSIH